MDGVLPDEFPFNKRKAALADSASAVEHAAPVESSAPEISDAEIERVEVEKLVEISSGGAIVYRGKERRRSPRQALRAKAIYRDEARPSTGGPVQVMNISMFGMRIWSPRAMAVGDKGAMRMELGPVKWASKVRIVTCHSIEDEGHLIGCEFIAKEISRPRTEAA